MFSDFSIKIFTGIIVTLFTSWYIYRRREKLLLSYTVTESDLFPMLAKYGKYYALKISNNGGKLICNVTGTISITNGTLTQATPHELVNFVEEKDGLFKFTINSLNPKEDIDLIFTAQATEDSVRKIKIRAEGVNAIEKSTSPTRAEVTSTAVIFCVIGFFSAFIYLYFVVDSKTNEKNNIENIFYALTKAKLPHIFHEINREQVNPSFEGTCFHLVDSYLQDTTNKEKYINGINNIADLDGVANSSKAVAYYLIYKIHKKNNSTIQANIYLEKCKDIDDNMYSFLIAQDANYDLNLVEKHSVQSKTIMVKGY